MIPIQPDHDTASRACHSCKSDEGLTFDFDYAYQPIVDLSRREIVAHEALVRGPNGESAYSVLSQVNDANRYMFDQACRVKAIRGFSDFGFSYVYVIFEDGTDLYWARARTLCATSVSSRQ